MPPILDLVGHLFLSGNASRITRSASVDHGQRQRELILLSDWARNGNGKQNAVMPESAGTN